jgi:transposase-like protein
MNEPADVPKAGRPRRRLSLQQKADYLERFLQSGLTVAEFCRQTQLAPSCLQRWLKLLEPAKAQGACATQPAALFQELPMPKPPTNVSWSVELCRPNGTVLRLAQPLSPPLLEQLLGIC